MITGGMLSCSCSFVHSNRNIDSHSTRAFYNWASRYASDALFRILATLWRYETEDGGVAWVCGFTHSVDEHTWCTVTLYSDHAISEERRLELLSLTDGRFSLFFESQ